MTLIRLSIYYGNSGCHHARIFRHLIIAYRVTLAGIDATHECAVEARGKTVIRRATAD